MTPAPISVERLRELLDKASEWRCTGDVLRCTDGNGCECDLSGNPSPWMELQSAAVNALPALLQQLAEREAECKQHLLRALENGAAYQAAERAREEATGLLREVLVWRRTVPPIAETPRKDGGIFGRIAAFLAANGGSRED